MWRHATWVTSHGGRAESSPSGGIAPNGVGTRLATTRPGPSNGNPSEQQGHGQQPARSGRGATALAGAAHPAMGSRWHPPAQAHGQPGGGYSKRSLRALASPGATGLLWVGFQSKPAPGMGQRHRPPQRIRRQTPSAWPVLAILALVLATLAILLVNQNHSGDPLKVRRELRKF